MHSNRNSAEIPEKTRKRPISVCQKSPRACHGSVGGLGGLASFMKSLVHPPPHLAPAASSAGDPACFLSLPISLRERRRACSWREPGSSAVGRVGRQVPVKRGGAIFTEERRAAFASERNSALTMPFCKSAASGKGLGLRNRCVPHAVPVQSLTYGPCMISQLYLSLATLHEAKS